MNTPYSHLLFVAVAAIGILAYDWRKLRDKRTKAAYLILYVSGVALSFVLVMNPDLPGPAQVLNPLFSPLSKWLFQP
ncbi:hypothetical protein [Paenibacillus xylaniclasticus]|uniref:hypothetical protein n=1 Tax=Paenibacillus xylaniclasticus TaxID=588083 RepID=UPI000FD97CC6|nr:MULTISPECIES: hypothetical protein [Paenibacillus]GFN32709.1 hypothetical protein PCURB6_29690 [Paenibacillus curdlanolyticus]